jgi:AcrR family transcriptional regulator
MNPSETKERIIDAAERLFAQQGFHCTSLRTITREAKVNLAAVHYHFGSKESLLEAVFERRLVPLNRLRRERLDAVIQESRRQGRLPEVRPILAAFIEPSLLLRKDGSGAEDFISLIGRSLVEPDEAVRRHFLRLISPLVVFLFDCLHEALPSLPREELYWRLHFTLGALSHTMCLGGKSLVPDELSPEVNIDAVMDRLLLFVTHGMETT